MITKNEKNEAADTLKCWKKQPFIYDDLMNHIFQTSVRLICDNRT